MPNTALAQPMAWV